MDPVGGSGTGQHGPSVPPRAPVGVTSGAPDAPARLARADRAAFARYAGSHAGADCHREAYDDWFYSHHARAERELHPVRDGQALDPHRVVTNGVELFHLHTAHGRPRMSATFAAGPTHSHLICQAIGVRPPVQYLVPFPGGRLQVTPVAYDPQTQEWFHVFGLEQRQPGEWGYWTGHGMNWNSMCAQCHNTAVRKNHGPSTARYATVMVERGVGCEACHGPMRDHVLWQRQNSGRGKPDPTLPRWSPHQTLDICAGCHSRRTELTGQFRPGDSFEDHYLPAIVDATDTFYPDGQVRDENFEWAAFLGSRMHTAGVSCLDCHPPHGGRLRLPGNLLCLQCHAPGRHPRAPGIDPLTHSRHRPGSSGDQCVQCHMSVTVYMQRHPWHDHGFTIPDPWLTLQFGIPNACNRCHTREAPQWALHPAEQWYGTRLARPERSRTAAIARARTGDPEAWADLLQALAGETNAYWRAVLVQFLGVYLELQPVRTVLSHALVDSKALVRLAAVRAVEQALNRGLNEAVPCLEPLLGDPARSVRVAAA